MQLFNRLRKLKAAGQIARVANDIAQRCVPSALARAGTRVDTMSMAELRGYARSRMLDIVDRELDAVMKFSPSLGSWFREGVRDQAIEILAESVVAARRSVSSRPAVRHAA